MSKKRNLDPIRPNSPAVDSVRLDSSSNSIKKTINSEMENFYGKSNLNNNNNILDESRSINVRQSRQKEPTSYVDNSKYQESQWIPRLSPRSRTRSPMRKIGKNKRKMSWDSTSSANNVENEVDKIHPYELNPFDMAIRNVLFFRVYISGSIETANVRLLF